MGKDKFKIQDHAKFKLTKVEPTGKEKEKEKIQKENKEVKNEAN